MKKELIVAAIFGLIFSGIAGAEDLRGISRAEVKADLAIWKLAGMAKFSNVKDTNLEFTPQYRERYAKYLEMRNGPEYARELAHLQETK